MSINFYANFSDENRASVIEIVKQHYGVDDFAWGVFLKVRKAASLFGAYPELQGMVYELQYALFQHSYNGVDAPFNVLNDVLYGDLETLRDIDLGNSRNYRQCIVDLDPIFRPEDECFPNFGNTHDAKTIREILLVAFDASTADKLLHFIHSINWS